MALAVRCNRSVRPAAPVPAYSEPNGMASSSAVVHMSRAQTAANWELCKDPHTHATRPHAAVTAYFA